MDRFVPVRVTDVRGFDLATFSFDFDLTIALLTAHPDGTVYHRFGGRDERGADRFLTVRGLVHTLRASLERHGQAEPLELAAAPAPRRTIEDFPSYGPWLERRGAEVECLHCHNVGEHEIRSARMAPEGFDMGSIWRWPSPRRVGFDLGTERQTEVVHVAAGSPAAAAGMRVGDRLVTLRGVPVASFTDVQHGLHGADGGATGLDLTLLRDWRPVSLSLRLPEGWKRGDARSFSWRPLKWGLPAGPGFGGMDVGPARKRALGLAPGAHAFRIGYFVTWGEFAHRGRAAARHLRVGDVVFAVNGKADFQDQDHFHGWFRLNMEPGDTARIGIVRDGERLEVPIEVQR